MLRRRAEVRSPYASAPVSVKVRQRLGGARSAKTLRHFRSSASLVGTMLRLRHLSGTFKRSFPLSSRRHLAIPTSRATRVRKTSTVAAFDEADRSRQQLKAANEWQWQEQQLEAVLKVYSVVSSPSYTLPWQNKPQKETSGSAFVLKGRRIITNAHVVSDYKYSIRIAP